MSLQLTPEQYDMLLAPLDPKRISENREGKTYLEAWDVRRWLIRVFGFGGWTVEYPEITLVHESAVPNGKNNKGDERFKYTVVYTARCRLTVVDRYGNKAVFEDAASGDGANLPSFHASNDFAVKTACSQALKRCAVNLGDLFGLPLYNNGRTDAVVGRTLCPPDGQTATASTIAEVAANDVVERDPDDVEAEQAAELAAKAAEASQIPAPANAQPAQPKRTSAPPIDLGPLRAQIFRTATRRGMGDPVAIEADFLTWSGGTAFIDATAKQYHDYEAYLRQGKPGAAA